VRQHCSDYVAALDAALGERRSETPRPLVELGVGVARAAVNDRDAIGMDLGRARQENDRTERGVVRGAGLQGAPDAAGFLGHRSSVRVILNNRGTAMPTSAPV